MKEPRGISLGFLRFAQFTYCGPYTGFGVAEDDPEGNSAGESTVGAIERQSDGAQSTDVPGLASGASWQVERLGSEQ